MIQFAAPIWLWAITGIAIPIVIHLWNVKQGKTRKVGSVLFLTETARSQAASFKIAEWLLLLIRCLLLVVLALLLSGPFLLKQDTNTKEKGWVLIEQSNAGMAYRSQQRLIDSLLQQGYTLHYFSKDFPAADIEELLKQDTIPKETKGGYWTLLRELNQQVSARLPLYLFTDNRLQNFNGTRPSVAMNIKWYTYALPVNQKDGSKTDSNAVHHVFIYADQSTTADASYLIAALHAIGDFTGTAINAQLVRDTKNIRGRYDWLFWLSENEMPAALMQQHVFTYVKGKPQDVHSTIITSNQIQTSLTEPLQLYKLIETEVVANANALWRDGYGHPILSKGGSGIYRFNSRFDPLWNDLPWSGEFPEIIYHLLYPTAIKKANEAGGRIIDIQQVQPSVVDASAALPKSERIAKTEYSYLFWVIAFILFALERTMVYQKKRRAQYA